MPFIERFLWAARVNHAICIKMSDGSQVYGNKGDYVLLTDDDDLVVVDKLQFAKEYQKILSQSEVNAIVHAIQVFENKEEELSKKDDTISIVESIKTTTPLSRFVKPIAPKNKRLPTKPLSQIQIETKPESNDDIPKEETLPEETIPKEVIPTEEEKNIYF